MKKIILIAFGLSLGLASCKKVDALSGSDPSTGIAPSSEPAAPTQDPANGGLPPMPETAPAPPANGKYPVMAFEVTEHDFGTINAGDKVTYNFKFKNTGQSDLLIANAVGSCGCTVPEYPKTPVKPGESGEMKVSFNSAGKSGNQQKTVTITANTQAGRETLTIKANITPKNQ